MHLLKLDKHKYGNSIYFTRDNMVCFLKSSHILLGMQYISCCSDKYTEIKMYDLELFSKIQSHLVYELVLGNSGHVHDFS